MLLFGGGVENFTLRPTPRERSAGVGWRNVMMGTLVCQSELSIKIIFTLITFQAQNSIHPLGDATENNFYLYRAFPRTTKPAFRLEAARVGEKERERESGNIDVAFHFS